MTPPTSSSVCRPRFATERSPERETFGPAIAAVAERLGQPFMPWQRMVADVGGEIDPATGLPAYRNVVVTVPRQSGKTVLLLAWMIQRALGWGEPQRIAYSAQTGNDARKKLVEDWVPLLDPRKSKLGISRILTGMGNEAISFRNGSRIVLLASSEDSGHGKTLDQAVKDEFFADYDDRRDQALIPAMATRAAAQVLTASTMGTDDSVPLNNLVTLGRQAVLDGQRQGVAYFEWSAGEDDDLDDPASWWRFMPALGHTQTPQVIADAKALLKPGEFRRAFGNIATKSDERVIPTAAWDLVCSPDAAPSGQMVFALDVNPERSAGAIASCGDRAVEVVEHRAGVGWVVDAAAALGRVHSAEFAVDMSGPAASLVPDLKAAGVRVRELGVRETVDACGAFYDAVGDRTFSVRRHQGLDAAVAGAAKKQSGDSWRWARRSAASDISPLMAVTLALWASKASGSIYETRGLAST